MHPSFDDKAPSLEQKSPLSEGVRYFVIALEWDLKLNEAWWSDKNESCWKGWTLVRGNMWENGRVLNIPKHDSGRKKN